MHDPVCVYNQFVRSVPEQPAVDGRSVAEKLHYFWIHYSTHVFQYHQLHMLVVPCRTMALRIAMHST